MIAESDVNFDALVVGAGPVGLVAANLLGKYELRTLLIECNDCFGSEPRAIGIDDETLRILQALDIEPEKIRSLCKTPKIEYFSPSGYRCFEPEATPTALGYPILSTFLQPKLEQCLRNKLLDYPSVSFLSNIKFKQYYEIKQNKRLIAKIVDKHHNRNIHFNVNYLLGCDGGKSTVRRSLNLKFSAFSNSEPWLVIDLVDSEELRLQIQQYKNSQKFNRQFVTIDLPEGLRRFEIKLLPSEYSQEKFDQNKVDIILNNSIKMDPSTIIRARVYERNICIVNKFFKKNVFLLGDAAHLVPPYGGQGMCSGIRDAMNLCWKIALDHKLNGQTFPLLKSYHLERRYHILKTIDFIKKLTVNLTDVKSLNQRKVDAIITTDYYSTIKPIPYYRSGFFFQSFYAGFLLPQPTIYNKNNQCKKLDTLLGNYFSLISINCSIDTIISKESRDFLLKYDFEIIRLDTHFKVQNNKSNYFTDTYFLEEPHEFWLKLDNHILLVRPDRFIFTSTSINQINILIEDIKQLFTLKDL